MDHDLQVSILKELMTQLDEGNNIDVDVQYKKPTTGYTCPEIAAKERESLGLFPQRRSKPSDIRRVIN